MSLLVKAFCFFPWGLEYGPEFFSVVSRALQHLSVSSSFSITSSFKLYLDISDCTYFTHPNTHDCLFITLCLHWCRHLSHPAFLSIFEKLNFQLILSRSNWRLIFSIRLWLFSLPSSHPPLTVLLISCCCAYTWSLSWSSYYHLSTGIVVASFWNSPRWQHLLVLTLSSYPFPHHPRLTCIINKMLQKWHHATSEAKP